jgi:hypothetical protein
MKNNLRGNHLLSGLYKRPIQKNNMKNIFYFQLLFELDTWKRIFESMQNENNFLKQRLTQIIKIIPGKKEIINIEYFQNLLVTQDRVIAIFRNDIEKQKNKFSLNKTEEKNKLFELILSFQQLRNEIKEAEFYFNDIKFEFNEFFQKYFLTNLEQVIITKEKY